MSPKVPSRGHDVRAGTLTFPGCGHSEDAVTGVLESGCLSSWGKIPQRALSPVSRGGGLHPNSRRAAVTSCWCSGSGSGCFCGVPGTSRSPVFVFSQTRQQKGQVGTDVREPFPPGSMCACVVAHGRAAAPGPRRGLCASGRSSSSVSGAFLDCRLRVRHKDWAR